VEKNEYFYATYSAASRTISSTIVTNGYTGMGSKTLNTVRLLGASNVVSVTVNGVAHTDFEMLPTGEVAIRNLNLAANQAFTITY